MNDPKCDQDGNTIFVTIRSVGRKVVGVVTKDGEERYRTVRYPAGDHAEARKMAEDWAKATYRI